MSRLFASGGQSIAASVLASVLPVTIQGWFPLGLTGLNSLLSKGLSRVPFWLWLLLQLAAAFSAALSQLGLSPPFSASASADLWIFKLFPLLWCLSPTTHTVSCPFSLCLTSSLPSLENVIGLVRHYPGWIIPAGESNVRPFQCHLPSLSGCPDGLTLVLGSFICGQSDGDVDEVVARGCSWGCGHGTHLECLT